MAYRITRDCIACGCCMPKCANGAIFVTDADEYAIDSERCTECIDLPKRRCQNICTVGAIQRDPDLIEAPKELWEKHRSLRAVTDDFPGS